MKFSMTDMNDRIDEPAPAHLVVKTSNLNIFLSVAAFSVD